MRFCQRPFWIQPDGVCQEPGWLLPVSTAISDTCDGWPSGWGYTNAAVIAWCYNGGKGDLWEGDRQRFYTPSYCFELIHSEPIQSQETGEEGKKCRSPSVVILSLSLQWPDCTLTETKTEVNNTINYCVHTHWNSFIWNTNLHFVFNGLSVVDFKGAVQSKTRLAMFYKSFHNMRLE